MQLPWGLDLSNMQTKWKSILDPLLSSPIPSGLSLPSISLVSGINVVNHQLGRKLQGWYLVRKRQWLTGGVATVYDVSDTQDTNATPEQTLTLYCTQGSSSNPAVIDLWVY